MRKQSLSKPMEQTLRYMWRTTIGPLPERFIVLDGYTFGSLQGLLKRDLVERGLYYHEDDTHHRKMLVCWNITAKGARQLQELDPLTPPAESV